MAGSKPYYQETWFTLAFLSACFGAGYLLFHYLMPPVNMSSDTVQTVAMAKLFSEGRIFDAFARFNQPPVYALLMAAIIKLTHTMELPRLIHSFQQLNMGLYFASIALVFTFISRQISKPYSFIITALYALAPSTLDMAWNFNPFMAYTVLSLGALFAVDYSLSQTSAMAGQITRGELVLCGSFLGASILTHQVGYLLVIAFFFVMLKRFGLKHSATVLAALILVISPFIGRDAFQVFHQPGRYTTSSIQFVRMASQKGIFKTLHRYADHTLFSVAHNAVGDLNLSSLDPIAEKSHANVSGRIGLSQQTWGRWALGIIALVGAIYGLYQYTGIGTLYLSAYVLTTLVLLPQPQMPLAPAMPLILLYLYYGMIRTGEWMKRVHLPINKIAVPALTIWILLCTFTTHLTQFSEAKSHRQGHQPQVIYMNTAQVPQNRLEKAQTNAAHHRAMEWLKDHTQPNARVAIPRPEAASALTHVDTNSNIPQQQAMRKELANYDYLVEENAGESVALRKQRGGITSAQGMNLVYEDVAGRIRIWEVKPVVQ